VASAAFTLSYSIHRESSFELLYVERHVLSLRLFSIPNLSLSFSREFDYFLYLDII